MNDLNDFDFHHTDDDFEYTYTDDDFFFTYTYTYGG